MIKEPVQILIFEKRLISNDAVHLFELLSSAQPLP